LNCPECGRATTADLWLIIDTAERPDLVARARDGTLHHMICPRGHVFVADVALLVYRPGQAQPLVFSPAGTATEAQNQQMAVGYLGQLAGALGDAWHDAWLDDALLIPRAELADFLTDEPTRAALDAVFRLPGVGEALSTIMLVLAEEGVEPQTSDELWAALAERPALAAALRAAVESALPVDAPDATGAPPPGEGRPRRMGKRKGRGRR
jgi:hypothetical protein